MTRAYLKALREAEMTTWKAASPVTLVAPESARAATLDLVRTSTRTTSHPAETWLFGLLAVLAGTALGWGFSQAIGFAEHFEGFVRFVRHVLG